jgi:phenylacetate-CoA ligase
MGLADKLYPKLPTLAQHAAVTAWGYTWKWRRFGGEFNAVRDAFIARERYGLAEWHAYQTQELRNILRLAMRAPYYRALGLDDRRIDRFELSDLASLPILEKSETRANPEAFLVDGVDRAKLTICPTSGSTGTPVRTYWSNSDFRRALALREARSCRPANVSFALPRATFSGRIVVPDPKSTGPFYRYNLAERQVYFSAFHLSPQNARAYVRALERHKTVWATGYTHSFEQLALMMIDQAIPPPPTLRAIITTSEKLTPSGRAAIERAFGCKAFEEYGQVEDACFAGERADGRLYASPDAGILEIVRPDGTSIPYDDPSEGQVVATSFSRRSQIFLRYRLGDVLRWDPAHTAATGTPVIGEISGRIEDVIVAPDGRRTVRFHAVFTELRGVREAQVIQEARDRVRILVVPSRDYGPETADEIVRRVQQRLTTDMNVEVTTVESIPRTAAGKFQAVVSRLKAASS